MLLALIRMEIFRYLMVAGLVSSSLHVDIRKKYILLLGKGPTQRLDDTTQAAKKEYAINFRKQHKKICLSLHYNNVNSQLLANGDELYKFKAKEFEINAPPLCLGNFSKDVSADSMKKIGIYRHVYDFSVNYDSTDVAGILYIHKYLMVKKNMK